MSGDGGKLLNGGLNVVKRVGNEIDRTVTGRNQIHDDEVAADQEDTKSKGMSLLAAGANDETLDPQTRAEFSDAYNSNNLSLASSVKAAKAGEGIYGIRRKNYELSKLLVDRPGSNQTILSTDNAGKSGSGTILGG